MTNEIPTTDIPIETRGSDAPNPAEKTVPGSEPKSIDDALAKAFKDQGVDEASPKPKEAKEPQAEVKEKAEPKQRGKEDETRPSRERSEDGKFASRTQESSPEKAEDVGAEREGEDKPRSSEGRNVDQPPARFLPRAKEKWPNVDPDVKGEVYRAFDEMQKGLEEYKEDREFRKAIKPYEDMAKQYGTSVPNYLENTLRINQHLSQDLVGGLDVIARQYGYTLEQVAQHITQQAQVQQQNPHLAHTQRLEQQVAQLTQQIQQMGQMTAQQQQEAQRASAYQAVEQNVILPFKQSHPRYDELQDDIAFFLNSDRIPSTLSAQQRLEEAYFLAERLNPAPNAKGPLTPAVAAPLTQAGNKSVSGSPSPGIPTSKPKKKGEHVSIDDALERALQRHVG